MIPTVLVNALTVVHLYSDGIAVCSAPDCCKTPPSGAPVPYVNVAYSKDLVNGSATVFANGSPVALKDSMFLPSYGDEPGTMGGVISGVNMGKAKFSNYSMDVFIEGRNVARLSDPMTMNGNQPNTLTTAEIQRNLKGVLPDDLLALLCQAFCWCDYDPNCVEGGDDPGGERRLNKGKDFVEVVQKA
jgi:uncharacterized Zn-binding protein involved in type VI secretion